MSDLSSIQQLEKTVRFGNDGVSITDTAGDMINNREFKEGFFQFKAGNVADSRQYIWQAISAVGEDLGDALYTNIRHYIDVVSDVDTCNIQQLKSMMNMLGFDYTIIDKFDQYPVELLKMMNIFTINNKFLKEDGMLRAELLSALYEKHFDSFGSVNSVISGKIQDLSSYLRKTDKDSEIYKQLSGFLEGGKVYLDNRIVGTEQGDPEKKYAYYDFVWHAYANLILGYLTLKYGEKEYALADVVADEKIKDHIQFIDNDTRIAIDGDNREYKQLHGIPLSFDESKIADDINDGNDSLENYGGWEATLLSSVIDQRKMSKDGMPLSRYAYYIKRKVKQYRDFVLDKFFSITLGDDNGGLTYKNDPNYYFLTSREKTQLFIIPDDKTINEKTPFELLESGIINKEVFYRVIHSLVDVTMYITKLRQKIKLQTRKNYMRGTNNLLLYIINEYLLDYQRHSSISSDVVRDYFKENPPKIQNLKVVEYIDKTEYYNIKTDEDYRSLSSGQTTNDRFWEEEAQTSKDKAFALNQIQDFYLSTMNMKYSYCQLSSNYRKNFSENDFLWDFLDAVYDCGAMNTSLNKDGYLNTNMSRDQEWTSDMKYHYDRLSSNYEEFNSYLSSTPFEHTNSAYVSAQLSDATENYIFVQLSNQYLSAVSEVHDRFIVSSDNLQARIDNLNNIYYELLSGKYEYYFTLPDKNVYPDCFDPDTGLYKHDYYWGNSNWDDGSLKYVFDKFNILLNFSNQADNIANHPLIDTTNGLSTALEQLSAFHYETIVVPLQTYGYMDINATSFEDELDSTQKFIDGKTNERSSYLINLINSLKEEAQNLRSSYTALKAAIPAAIASYKNSLGISACYIQDYVLAYPKKGYSGKESDNHPDHGDIGWVYCSEKGVVDEDGEKKIADWKDTHAPLYVYTSLTATKYTPNYHYVGTLNAPELINLDGDFEEIADQMMQFMTQRTSVELTSYKDSETGEFVCEILDTKYAYRDNGVVASLNNLIDSFNELKGSVASLQKTICDLYGIEISEITGSSLYDTIAKIISYLNDNGFNIYQSDQILKFFKIKSFELENIKAQFKTLSNRYQKDIFGDSKQSEYLADCKADSILTFANLALIIAYSKSKDETNKRHIQSQIQTAINDYTVAYDQFQNVVQDLSQCDTIESFSEYGYMLEDSVQNLVKFLEDDVEKKTRRQMLVIQVKEELIYGNLDAISSEVSSYLGLTDYIGAAVSSRLEEEYFYDKDKYIQDKEIFLEYAGQNFCYYPYFNFKNLEHPSYQIHPYLKNFVESDSYVEKLCKRFYNIDVEDFAADRISSMIWEYIGPYGNVIDRWKHDTIDHSGYTAKYEDSEHIQNQVFSKVVDFDGSFFPDTIRDLNTNKGMCLCSLWMYQNDKPATREELVEAIKDDLEDDISKHTVESIRSIVENRLSGQTTLTEDFNQKVGDYLSSSEYPSKYGLGIILTDVINETFFGNYYDHLGLSRTDVGIQIDKINEYWSDIKEITDLHELENVYDIYKYIKDINGNAFILFKQYKIKDLSYTEKKNVLGEVWMRMKNYPLAFPAFRGKHSNVCMTKENYCHKTIWRLSQTVPYEESMLSTGIDRGEYFYDMCQSGDGYYIGLIAYPTDKGHYNKDGVVKDEFNETETIAKNYENPLIINCYSTNIVDADNNVFNTLWSTETTSQYSQYIQSGYNWSERTHLSSSTQTQDIENLAYIGSVLNGTQNVYHIYATKTYKTDGEVALGTNLKYYWMNGGTIKLNSGMCGDIIKDQTGSDICFGYDKFSNTLTFAYLGGEHTSKYDVTGNVFENKTTLDMNSNDILTNEIKLVRANFSNSTMVFSVLGSESLNINADMSYIPAHPDFKKHTNLVDQRLFTEYRNVELLGRSKDLEDKFQKMNVNVNPYFDVNDISSNYLYGRVYEDYDGSKDKTLRMYQNPLITTTDQDIGRGYVEWSESLCRDYTAKDIANIRVLAYNVNALGKSNYLMTSLCSLIGNELSANYDTYKQHEEQISGLVYDIRVNGITFDNRGDYASNRILGFNNVTFRVDTTQNGLKLTTKFHLDDFEKPSKYAFINQGDVRIVLFNTNDLTQFDRYHMFDAYGVVYALSASQETATEIIDQDEGWIIIKNLKQDPYFDDVLRQYYKNKYGEKEEYKPIELSDYNNLSDVWLLKTSRRFQFKYDEGVFFDLSSPLYFYPGINCKYPKSMADYIQDNLVFGEFGQNNSMSSYFLSSNLFILDVLDNSVVDNLGQIDIPKSDYMQNCYRTYEEYLSTVIEDGREILNSDKCSVEDISSMCNYGFTHGYEDNDNTEDEIFVKISEEYYNQIATDKITISVTQDQFDFKDYMKIFVNYVKTENQTIKMYFNYFNLFNSPFVKIGEDGKTYPVLQENSYLALDTGEDGILDICVQLKYYNSNNLVGVKVVKLGSFHIYNISDDKPKFTMIKVDSTQENVVTDKKLVTMTAQNLSIDMNNLAETDYGYGNLILNIEQTDTVSSYPYDIWLEYPTVMISSLNDTFYSAVYNYQIVQTRLSVMVKQRTTEITIPCITSKPKGELTAFFNQEYPFYVDECDVQSDTITTEDGYVMLKEDENATV